MRNLPEKLKGKKIVFSSHENADCDGIGSIIALSSYFKNSKLYLPSVSRLGKKLLSHFKVKYESKKKPEGFLVMVDTHEGDFDFAIDHHFENGKIRNAIIEQRTSTAEIVYDLIGKSLGKKEKLALLCGIITDTGSFKYADRKTFETVHKILEDKNVKLYEAYQILRIPREKSETIARIKGAKRLTLHKAHGYLICTSHIGSFESKVAVSLMSLGCDISVVKSKKKNGWRYAMRTRESVPLNLAEIAEKLSEEGGGHKNAAGLTSKKDLEKDLLKEIKIVLSKN